VGYASGSHARFPGFQKSSSLRCPDFHEQSIMFCQFKGARKTGEGSRSNKLPRNGGRTLDGHDHKREIYIKCIKMFCVLFVFILAIHFSSCCCDCKCYDFEEMYINELNGNWHLDLNKAHSHSGNNSMKSADMRYAGTSSMFMSVTGPATVCFWWDLYNPCDGGSLRFVDEMDDKTKLYDPNRKLECYPIQDENCHKLIWIYNRTRAPPYSGAAWVDDICITKSDADFRVFPLNSTPTKHVIIDVTSNFDVSYATLEMTMPEEICFRQTMFTGFFAGANCDQNEGHVVISQFNNSNWYHKSTIHLVITNMTTSGPCAVSIEKIVLNGNREQSRPKIKHYWMLNKNPGQISIIAERMDL